MTNEHEQTMCMADVRFRERSCWIIKDKEGFQGWEATTAVTRCGESAATGNFAGVLSG